VKIQVIFWVFMLYSVVNTNTGRPCYLYLYHEGQDSKVSYHNTMGCHNPEDLDLKKLHFNYFSQEFSHITCYLYISLPIFIFECYVTSAVDALSLN